LSLKPATFDQFLRLLQEGGYEVKQGKSLAFRAIGQQKYTRLRSLGEGYSEDELRAVISGTKLHTAKNRKVHTRDTKKVNLLVDIQAKLQSGKGPGYERWAKVFNLKQMAKTINYLTEHNLTDYEALEQKVKEVSEKHYEYLQQIRMIEKMMAEIANLRKHIVNYSKTREIYVEYRKSGYNKKFYEEHTAEILLHQVAKKAFDSLSGRKIPIMKELQKDYGNCLAKKTVIKSEYNCVKAEMREILTVKANIENLMNEEISAMSIKNKDEAQLY
jgi:hypothetical protein